MQTRPAVKILGLFVLGTLTGHYFNFPVPLLILLVSLVLVVAFTIWYADKGNNALKEICIGAGLVLAGFAHSELATEYLPNNHISSFTNHRDSVGLLGTISKYPEPGIDKLSLTLSTREVFVSGKLSSTQGDILINVRVPGAQFNYGDEILVRAKLRKPRDRRNPGEFDYRGYRLAQGIYATMSVTKSSQIEIVSSGHGSWALREAVYPVKAYLENYLTENLPPHIAGLLQGLMIGVRSEVPGELREAFAKAGVIHLLAVSGLHVGFIILVFMGLLGLLRVPHVFRVLITLVGLIFYVYLTNLKPPVVRASFMGGLVLAGTLLGRKTDVFNTLAVAALLILIINPLELFQSGFQLSFAAVLSIVYIFPKLKRLASSSLRVKSLQRFVLVRYPMDLFLVSVAALLGTLPFTIYYFERLSGIALLANLWCVPLAFFGLANGMVAAALNLLFPTAAQLYLNAADVSLQALIHLVEWASRLPQAYWEIYRFPPFVGLAYIVALLLILNINRGRARRWLILYVLLLANVLLWDTILANEKVLKIIYFDVGQGDAALVTFPDGRHALIDGGPRTMNSDAGEWVIAPYLRRQGIKKIDALILSHADADHLGGLPHILRNFEVAEVWDNGQVKDTHLYDEYVTLIDSLNIVRRILRAGEHIADFSPVEILVAHPAEGFIANSSDANDGSLSLKISFGEADFLFVGDVEEKGESAMSTLGNLLQSEVLKVAHHGSRTSSTQALIEAVRPDWAVISVGGLNKFGHPAPSVVSRLARLGSDVVRTDQDAAIILESDGRTIQRLRWK